MVVKTFYTTTLIQRIADGFRALYSNNDIKKLKPPNPIYQTLPKEVQKVLLYEFKDLMDEDFNIITKHDLLNVPEGLADSVNPSKEIISFSPYKGEGTTPMALPTDISDPPKHENNQNEEEESDESDSDNENQDNITLRSGKRVKKVQFKPS